MGKRKEQGDFAIEFILNNAQVTTGCNLCVYGTLTPDQLSDLISAHPEGKAIYERACTARENGKKTTVAK